MPVVLTEPDRLLLYAIRPACELIAQITDAAIPHSDGAERMLLAIAWQESNWEHRRQISGPARGYWQFEKIGVAGVLLHDKTKRAAARLCELLDYSAAVDQAHDAIEHNDILAAGIARLYLWQHPDALPGIQGKDEGWKQYVSIWRPGKPKSARWDDAWKAARAAV